MSGLKEKALIVNITVSVWSGRKYDRKVTKEVNEKHDTDNAGNFNKILTDDPLLGQIKNIEGKIRKYHEENTLPWSDKGDRLLPTTNYSKYLEGLVKLVDEFRGLVGMFMNKYEQIKLDSKKRLKDLYVEKEFPTLKQLEAKFDVGTTFMPMPDAEDFRVSLNQAEVEKLKNQINLEIKDRHDHATGDLFERAKDAIQHIIESLSRESKDGKTPRLHDSTFNKIGELVELFPALNYTGDEKLTELTEEMKSLIVDPANLKKDEFQKRVVLERAKELEKMYF